MSRMRVAIRADASTKIGSGHVMRCLTLADGLRQRSAEIRFVTREHDGHLASLIEARGFACSRMPKADALMDVGDLDAAEHALWLGCTQNRDALDTQASLRDIGPVDWLIVDHYALDIRWERQLRKNARQIMVIDDLADRRHDCDVLLDQNLYTDFDIRYRSLIPQECVALLGPRYALLSPDFAHQRVYAESKRVTKTYRLLVFFGGVDATNETGKFLQAWASITRTDLAADVVIGQGNPRADSLTSLAGRLAGVRIFRHVTNMAEMMARADYAFGASGTTNWERFCIGLNSTITSVANNQLTLANDLADFDLINYLGDWRSTSIESYRHALLEIQPSADNFLQRKARIRERVDGQGVQRVVRKLAEKWL